MEVAVIVLDDKLKQSEVWMQKESGIIFLVHPLFANNDNQLHQVALAIDDNTGDSLMLLNASVYDDLPVKCEYIGIFYDKFISYGM